MGFTCFLEKRMKYGDWILNENKDVTTPRWLVKEKGFIIDLRESSARGIWKGPD